MPHVSISKPTYPPTPVPTLQHPSLNPQLISAGRTQIDRLLHIGTHSVPLSLEALKLVVQKLKQTEDVTRYRLAVSLLQKVAPEDPDAQLDQEWVDQTDRRVSAETEKIEAALKSYKHNLIKESIRVRSHRALRNRR